MMSNRSQNPRHSLPTTDDYPVHPSRCTSLHHVTDRASHYRARSAVFPALSPSRVDANFKYPAGPTADGFRRVEIQTGMHAYMTKEVLLPAKKPPGFGRGPAGGENETLTTLIK